MNSEELDILLVENNQDDMDLALHALERGKLANNIFVARDGEEALDFCREAFAKRSFEHPPNSYIQKPVDFDQFRETVRTIGLYWLVINQPVPTNGVREKAARG